ncbi:hypothetical protein HRG_006178 [Hirsutella rhossiliensis]|uniref:Uncharacterized protein n=1 Tax=Hirsutella rhossiliensis TaxID=111463 RepID=A0A9P8MWP6_9HYPO|nr:uncharacterized protein HRG_06178 [Hirsutella rhossiliensis]KAH0963668.1 hypothetical protein HRG_06178 [Hirsutella rhossiliensis]
MVPLPLLILLLAAVVIGAPALQPAPGIRVSESKCVHGSPTKTENYDIQYQEVKPPSGNGSHDFIVDPSWRKRHSTLGSSVQMSMGNPSLSYGEFKCQYSCGGIPGCVSFAGYESGIPIIPPRRGASLLTQGIGTVTGSKKFECYVFDSLIKPRNLVLAPDPKDGVMTHAYNRLCDDK